MNTIMNGKRERFFTHDCLISHFHHGVYSCTSNKNGSIDLNDLRIYGPEAILQEGTTYLPLRFLLEHLGYEVTYHNSSKAIGLKAILENNLTITSKEIGADGDGKSLLVYYPILSGFNNTKVEQKINTFLKQEADRFVAEGMPEFLIPYSVFTGR
ncbi:stalk domain-containing protein [Paenibacillus sp. CMAA1364]